MLLEENQISFHSDDEMVVDGVKDYSHQIAEMIGLGSDTEFRQAGVSFFPVMHSWIYLFFPFYFIRFHFLRHVDLSLEMPIDCF